MTSPAKSIVILKDPRQKRMFIDDIAERWKAAGHKVTVHRGPHRVPAADVVILHVDRNQVPSSYLQSIERIPVVLNRAVTDVSRHRYTTEVVRPDDSYDGPVIIKTNANSGGIPDTLSPRLSIAWKSLQRSCPTWLIPWQRLHCLHPHFYPIYSHKSKVPSGVWNNSRLLIQKFLPEQENGIFYLRYWAFLGRFEWTGRYGADTPIVKRHRRVTSDLPCEIPPSVRDLRYRLGLDYGRIDFVMNRGEPVVFDVNKTLNTGGSASEYLPKHRHFSNGLEDYLHGTQPDLAKLKPVSPLSPTGHISGT